MEEAIRILLGSRDIGATEDQNRKAFQMDGCQDGNPSSSNGCFVAVGGKRTKSKTGGRIEEVLHKLNDKKPLSASKKKKILLSLDKSLRKKLERMDLLAENSVQVSNDSMVQKTLVGLSHRSCRGLVRTRPYFTRPFNVYSYYYPKYDMSYGHCLYVTPWTLEVPADNTVQPARLSGVAKQASLRSLEQNWKKSGRKRRVNSARRSYTFPADAEWESTIYYFPRCDLSFCPLPFSKVRPPFGGDDAKLPAETVLEEEDNFAALNDSSCWKDLVEFEERNIERASCLTSDRTDLDSQSESSNVLPSMDIFSRTLKMGNPRHLCELTLQTVPSVAEGSSDFKLLKEENYMQRNRSGNRSNEVGSDHDTETMTTDLCATDSVWQQAGAQNLTSAETNEQHVDASARVSPHGDGDFDRCRPTMLCQENEKMPPEEPSSTNVGERSKVQTWKLKPKEAFHNVTRHFNSSPNTKISKAHPLHDTNSSTRPSEQVNSSKSRKLERNEKCFCKSSSKDEKSRSCPQRKDTEPLESLKQIKNNSTPSEEIPKDVSPKKEGVKNVFQKTHAVSVLCGYERKGGDENQSVGNVNRKCNNAVCGVDLKVKDCERHQGNNSQKNNHLRPRNVVTLGSGTPQDIGDDVLLEGSMKPEDNAGLRFRGQSTVPQDGLASTSTTKFEMYHVNKTDDTIPNGHLVGDFISGCSAMSTRKQGKSQTFSISAASMKETKGLHTTCDKQACTSKTRRCILSVGPLQVGSNLNKSSFSVTHDFVCRPEIGMHTGDARQCHTGITFKDVHNRAEQADNHARKISRTESISEESHQKLHEQQSNIRMHSVNTTVQEESISDAGKQRTSNKCVKLERKTALQKLVFVRSSASGMAQKTRAEDHPRHHSIRTRDSTIDLRVPERLDNDRKILQAPKKHTGNNEKAEWKSFQFGESKRSDSTHIGNSIQNKLRPRLKMLQDRPLFPVLKVPKTYLSIWQNRRAKYAEFLKRNPTFLSISNEHRTNRTSSRLSEFSAGVSDKNSPKSRSLTLSPLV